MATRVIVAGNRILMLRQESDETERVFWNAAWRLAQQRRGASALEATQDAPGQISLEALERARCWAYAREGMTYPRRVYLCTGV